MCSPLSLSLSLSSPSSTTATAYKIPPIPTLRPRYILSKSPLLYLVHISTVPVSRSSILMDFEYQESDIVFTTDEDQATRDWSSDEDEHDHYSLCNTAVVPLYGNSWGCGKSKMKKAKKKKVRNSPPVDIPETFVRSPESDYGFEDRDDEGEVVPPHVIVGRRVADRMASSVCFSHGRNLKGRYQSEMRNSILRMTGFLES